MKLPLQQRIENILNYCWDGIWSDTRDTRIVRLLKTINLSIRSFMDRGLQTQAAAMTFKTVLAIVPALALIFAIGKGFGTQNVVKEQLFRYFPTQSDALEKAFSFVDSYLAQSSEGIFVGVGIVFLLYTLISLLGSVEDAFNKIWGIKHGRTLLRKITDYTAIMLLLPVLLICSSGITVFMSSALQTVLPFEFMSPFISYMVDFLGLVLVWFFFMGAYLLIPNTRVRWKNALVAGILAGTCFFVLQWLFVTGQIYVTKYNAIYGSFAFLPLLLLWLQFVWLITLSGGVVCYSAQNISNFSYSTQLADISTDYRKYVSIGIMTIIVQRFKSGHLADRHTLTEKYGLPVRLVDSIINKLVKAALVNRVLNDSDKGEEVAFAPAIDADEITVSLVVKRLCHAGSNDFIKTFDLRFKSLKEIEQTAPDTLLLDISIE